MENRSIGAGIVCTVFGAAFSWVIPQTFEIPSWLPARNFGTVLMVLGLVGFGYGVALFRNGDSTDHSELNGDSDFHGVLADILDDPLVSWLINKNLNNFDEDNLSKNDMEIMAVEKMKIARKWKEELDEDLIKQIEDKINEK